MNGILQSPAHGPMLGDYKPPAGGPSLEFKPTPAAGQTAQAADVPGLVRRAQLALGLGYPHDAARFIHYAAVSSTLELTEEQRTIFASAHHHYIVSLLEQRAKLDRLIQDAKQRAASTSSTTVTGTGSVPKPDTRQVLSGVTVVSGPSPVSAPTNLNKTSDIKPSAATVAALFESRALQDYLGNVEFKLHTAVDEVIRTISQQLLPRAQSDAAVIWCWTMLGHYHRYTAQITLATLRFENKMRALSYYQKAMDVLLAKPGAYLHVEQTKSTLNQYMQEVSLV
uniref:14-3-3 domain-containing protein n=1 Tax=Mycena chlorophos TaxID=658473 RepID=A0ABQ0LE51_MYCCL|nr:predicted protein [Mycena chlorophos]